MRKTTSFLMLCLMLTLGLMILPQLGYCVNHEVTVYVDNDHNDPVEGAKCTLNSTSGYTNSSGYAVITVAAGNYTLTVSGHNYHTSTPYTAASMLNVNADKSVNVELRGGPLTMLVYVMIGLVVGWVGVGMAAEKMKYEGLGLWMALVAVTGIILLIVILDIAFVDII